MSCANNGNTNAEATKLGAVDPQSIKESDFQDVPGQAYGRWSVNTHSVSAGKPSLDSRLRLYLRKDKIAIRLTCSRNGKDFADLAGAVPATISETQITLTKSLRLAQEDCSFKPLGVFNYTLASVGLTEELNITDPSGYSLTLYREYSQNSPGQAPYSGSIRLFNLPNCEGQYFDYNPQRDCSSQMAQLGNFIIQSVQANNEACQNQQPLAPTQFCR